MRKIKDEIKNAFSLIILALSFQLPFSLPAFAQNAEQDAKDGQYEREIGNFSDAFKILNRGCNNGSADACASLGSMYLGDEGIPKDLAKSFSLATSACEKGSMRGCSFVGYHYQMGDPKIKNLDTARHYYQMACDHGFGNGCSNLGFMYYNGTSVAQSKEMSLELNKKGCEFGGGRACQNVAYFYRQGEVVSKEISKAITYYEKGCRFNSGPSCGALAYLYQGQEGVAKNLTTAKSFGEFGCSIKDTESCFQLGYIEATFLSQPQKALGHYQLACDKNDYLACNNIGTLYLFDSLGPRDFKKAKQYYQKACQGGEQRGCENLKTADIFAIESNPIDQIVKEAQVSDKSGVTSKTEAKTAGTSIASQGKQSKQNNSGKKTSAPFVVDANGNTLVTKKPMSNESLRSLPWAANKNEIWDMNGVSQTREYFFEEGLKARIKVQKTAKERNETKAEAQRVDLLMYKYLLSIKGYTID